jgi:predicted N-acetyltransferase YhbS
MIELTQPTPADLPAIEALLDRAFRGDRKRKTSYRYRSGVAPLAELARVARDEDRLVGTIGYWPLRIGKAGRPALLLGPLAVDAGARGQGLGGRLIESTLAAAAAAGHSRVLLVGDLGYYHRFGFVPAAGFGIAMPGERPERLLLRALREGAFSGVAGELRPARSPAKRPSGASSKPDSALLPAPQAA